MMVGGTQMPARVSTGDRDAVLRQIRWCAAVVMNDPTVTCYMPTAHTHPLDTAACTLKLLMLQIKGLVTPY